MSAQQELERKEPADSRNLVQVDRPTRLRIKQPFKILTDIWGVLTPYAFREHLYKYIDDNIESYLTAKLQSPSVQLSIESITKRTHEDIQRYPEMPPIPLGEESTARSVVDNLNFRRKHKDKNLMQGLDCIFNEIWNDGSVPTHSDCDPTSAPPFSGQIFEENTTTTGVRRCDTEPEEMALGPILHQNLHLRIGSG